MKKLQIYVGYVYDILIIADNIGEMKKLQETF